MLIVSINVSGCRSSDSAKPEPLEFEVDPALLAAAESVGELGVSFAPPKGWAAVRHVAQGQGAVGDGQGGASTPVLAEGAGAWANDNGAYCVVSPTPENELGDDARDRLEETYTRVLNNAQIRRAEFLKDGFLVHQFLITTPETVVFSLYFEKKGRTPFTVGYVVPRGQYASALRSVESSIGSVRVAE
ncbi:MAG: hypothetical protein O3A46_03460 [Candidatus Poribacteria bacterium]|nr:hypothetical protein [Candidatus Poribacteria bacterium]